VTERLPESRKLELNAYLTKPTTRLARYPLLCSTERDQCQRKRIYNVQRTSTEFPGSVSLHAPGSCTSSSPVGVLVPSPPILTCTHAA
ncbi:hypothetical protein FB446DRAFT_759996, partial [Lentinula raphanica]